MIEVKNLIKDYQLGNKQTLRALKGIELKFSSSEFTSILGQSGCGKTTLLNLIGGLDLPTEGDIIFNGTSISKMKDNQIDAYRNNQVGFILQNYYLIPNFNVLDNVKMALSFNNLSKEEIDKRARDILKKVGMDRYTKSFPKQLSGGQQQRVAIARAIVNNPSIILADEPTGSLDNSTAKEIMDLLKEIGKDKLVIMVTHNEEIAKNYSTRIIRMNDGNIISDDIVTRNYSLDEVKENKKVNLSFLARIKLAFKSILNKKLKTIMTIIATSFGMVGISFFLGLNHGFKQYANKFSTSIASSTPIVVTPYNESTDIIPTSEYNTTTEYPTSSSIYPQVSTQRETTYKYNNFSPKYFNFLNKMQREKLIREYYQLYSTDYALNLLTKRPTSIDGSRREAYGTVSNTNSSMIHVLYGELSDYDVIAGKKLDTLGETDLVLIVNKYNSISFSYLRALGFYSTADTEKSVMDAQLESKVKPITFDTVLQKEYVAFTNDDFYEKVDTYNTSDDMGITRKVSHYKVREINSTETRLTDLYNSDKGIRLKIASIIRPKKISGINAITPSLCYKEELMNRFVGTNTQSDLSNNLTNNVVFKYSGATQSIKENPNKGQAFIDEIKKISGEYYKDTSVPFPKSKINDLLNDFFKYYGYNNQPIFTGNYENGNKGFDSFLRDSIKLGVDLVDSSLLGKDLSDMAVFNEQIEKIQSHINSLDFNQVYLDVISIVGYMNAYSLVERVVIYPSGINQRQEILNRLDSFNEIQENSADHASNLNEVVLYSPENKDFRVEQVTVVMNIVYEILAIFVAICLVVASSMIAVITSSNVIERTKEIGLLRSLGSRKKDIAFLFELEAFITGFISGLISSLITLIMQIPLNHSISKNYPGFQLETICNFTWYHVLIVLGISIAVGLLAALVPSLKAANKNPVDCLRSD